MKAFGEYSIPIQGLKVGVYQYKFAIDNAFFSQFDGSPIAEGQIEFDLQFDRRSDMFLLDFELVGHVKAECDRCTATIDLPIEDTRQLIVKYGETEGEEEDEVVFIHRDAPDFNVAKYLYEFAVLALPITNTFDCQAAPNPPCNFDVLQYLKEESGADKPSSVWDDLRKLNSDN
jgi:uncharacterized metal-binding protein YceD (DUF177 family)